MLRALAAFTLLFFLFACSDVGVYGSADLLLFRWPGNASKGAELAIPSEPSLSGTSWLAKEISGHGVFERAEPTITFDGEGGVAGSSGCDRYFGPVTIKGSAIRFGKLAAAREACVPALMDQERRFFDTIAATRAYRFDDLGHTLVFLGKNDTFLARFSFAAP